MDVLGVGLVASLGQIMSVNPIILASRLLSLPPSLLDSVLLTILFTVALKNVLAWVNSSIE